MTEAERAHRQVEARASIHVVDDNDVLRDDVEEKLKRRLSGEPVRVHKWRHIWNLFEDPAADPPLVGNKAVRAGDVVITDLYPAGYWSLVPGRKTYEPKAPGVDDAGNIVMASHDVVRRFLRPLKDAGAEVLLITFVPRWLELEAENPEAAHLASRARDIRQKLYSQNFAGVYYKRDQSPAPRLASEPGASRPSGKALADVDFADWTAFDAVLDHAVDLVHESRKASDG